MLVEENEPQWDYKVTFLFLGAAPVNARSLLLASHPWMKFPVGLIIS